MKFVNMYYFSGIRDILCLAKYKIYCDSCSIVFLNFSDAEEDVKDINHFNFN